MTTDDTIRFTTCDDEGYDVERELPAKYEVCPRCRGAGKHTNPNIDGNGITASEWAEWDDDEREGYFTGRYDVTCHECGGLRVVLVVDEDACDPGLLDAYRDACADAAYVDHMAAQERAMGC